MSSAVKRGDSKPAASEPTGKAGRDLPAAIAVGIGLGAVLLASLVLLKVVFAAIVALAVAVGLRELSLAFQERGVRFPLLPAAVGGVGMVAGAYFSGEGALAVILALTAAAVLVWRLADGAEGFLRDVSAGVFAVVYVPFLAGFAALLAAEVRGTQRVVIFLALVVCNDTGGYAAGATLGRHPMAPRISPKKSWEGLGGSLVLSAVGGAVMLDLLLGGKAWQGALLGVAVVVTATLGDLCESMIKRDLGIKDMGTLLPGHGGLMDRLDSLLPTAPVAWLLLTLFVPTH
jgi:phosphatidate cytidylyltransferase